MGEGSDGDRMVCTVTCLCWEEQRCAETSGNNRLFLEWGGGGGAGWRMSCYLYPRVLILFNVSTYFIVFLKKERIVRIVTPPSASLRHTADPLEGGGSGN